MAESGFIYTNDFLKKHYCSILEKNREKIADGGTGDPYLAGEAADSRMALALVLRISPQITAAGEVFLSGLHKIEPDLYIYPGSDFHITVLDILRGEPDRRLPENIQAYASAVRDCASLVAPFQIRFEDVTASNSALLLCGYYEQGLQDFREKLRHTFRARGLLLEERYETFSCHITAARIITKLSDPDRFLTFLSENEHKKFGTMTVTGAELVFHNWYDSKVTYQNHIKLGSDF